MSVRSLGFTTLVESLAAAARVKRGRELASQEICPISSMNDLVEMIVWADRTLTF